jgi:hypothetical protein
MAITGTLTETSDRSFLHPPWSDCETKSWRRVGFSTRWGDIMEALLAQLGSSNMGDTPILKYQKQNLTLGTEASSVEGT